MSAIQAILAWKEKPQVCNSMMWCAFLTFFFIIIVAPSIQAILDILKLLLHRAPVGDLTVPVFATETMVFELICEYVHKTDHLTADTINHWMGMDGNWGETSRLRINGKRPRGRHLHLVKEEYRGKCLICDQKLVIDDCYLFRLHYRKLRNPVEI